MTNRKEEILEATGELILKEGYSSLTTQRVADEVGITSAGVHYHFETKEDLVVALIEDREEALITMLEATEGPPDKRLTEIVRLQFGAVEAVAGTAGSPTLQLVSASTSEGDPVRETLVSMHESYVEFVTGVIREGVAQGVFESDDPERVAVLLSAFENAAEVRTALGLDAGDIWAGLSHHVLEDLYVEEPPEVRR